MEPKASKAKAGRPGKPSRRPAALDERGRRRLRELRQDLLAYYPGPMPRSRLVLMDVDPSTLHAYWSIDADYLAGLRRRHRTRAAPLVLRLHELKGPAEATRHLDFELEGLTNNRYVNLWSEGRTYLGQIGLRTRRRFISVATSAPVRMPELGPAPAPSAKAGPEDQPPEDQARVVELEAEREALIRSRYRELAERAAAGGPEGLRPGNAAPETPPKPAAARPAEAAVLSPAEAVGVSPAAPRPAPGQAAPPQDRPRARPPKTPAAVVIRRAGWSLDLALGLKVVK